LLAQFLAAVVYAAPSPSQCIKRLPNGIYQEPLTFTSLRACQKREAAAFTDSIFSNVITTASIKDFKAFDARQLQEQADYKLRHPDAQMAEAEEMPAEPAAARAPAKPRRQPNPLAPFESIARSPDERLSSDMTQALRDFGIKK
jgi:hypothetical protein